MPQISHIFQEALVAVAGVFFPVGERPLSNRRLVSALLLILVLFITLGLRPEWQGALLVFCVGTLAFLTGELSLFQKTALLLLACGMEISESLTTQMDNTNLWKECFGDLGALGALIALCSLLVMIVEAILVAARGIFGWVAHHIQTKNGVGAFLYENLASYDDGARKKRSLLFCIPRPAGSNVQSLGFLMFLLWLLALSLAKALVSNPNVSALLWSDQALLGTLVAGLLGLHKRLWSPLKLALLIFAGYYAGDALHLQFSQIECQPMWTHLLRTIFGVAWLSIPFCLARSTWARREAQKLALALGLSALTSAFLLIPVLRISARPVDCLPYLAKLRPVFLDRSGESAFGLLNYKLGVCGCWQSTRFQRAYAEMILDVSPIGTGRFSFDGWQIKDSEAERTLVSGLIKKQSWGALFPEAGNLIKNSPEQERLDRVKTLLAIYRSQRLWEIGGNSRPGEQKFKEFAPYLANLLAKYDSRCALPNLFELYKDNPGNGVGLSIIEVCYKTGYRLSRDEASEYVFLYELDEREQFNQKNGVVDERAPLAYLPDVAEDPNRTKQLIMKVQPGIDEDFFRRNRREPFGKWAHERFDPPDVGNGIDISLNGLWD